MPVHSTKVVPGKVQCNKYATAWNSSSMRGVFENCFQVLQLTIHGGLEEKEYHTVTATHFVHADTVRPLASIRRHQ